MEYWKITSLENLQEVYEGVLYTEEWRTIPGYEGIYEASSFGRIKSLRRKIIDKLRRPRIKKEQIRRQNIGHTHGYLHIGLMTHGVNKIHKVHRLIMLAFFGESDLPVDHIDCERRNNFLRNLRYLDTRENISRGKRMKRSLATGVVYAQKRYVAKIYYKGVIHHIGSYGTEKEAADRYELVLGDIENIANYTKRKGFVA